MESEWNVGRESGEKVRKVFNYYLCDIIFFLGCSNLGELSWVIFKFGIYLVII